MNQKRLPTFFGTAYDVFIMTSPVLMPINFLMLSATAYAVTRDYLLVWFPWLTYAIFLTTLIVFYILTMMLIYTFLYASYFAHRNRQEYRHDNPIRRDIAVLSKKIDRIAGLNHDQK